MNFKELLLQAQAGDLQAQEEILWLYRPLLMKESVINRIFDEDVYQELCITLLTCIKRFKTEPPEDQTEGPGKFGPFAEQICWTDSRG